jgi:hypothetical protein
MLSWLGQASQIHNKPLVTRDGEDEVLYQSMS